MTAVFVVLGAMIGAPLRYLVSRAVSTPWGTFVVNIAGCFVLGALAGATSGLYAFAGTGFCGALTTYSTFAYETLQLVERRAYRTAVVNVVASAVLGVGAAALGWTIS